MSLEQLIGMLLNFFDRAALPVVFVTEEGDRLVTGIRLRNQNFDPEGPQVLELS